MGWLILTERPASRFKLPAALENDNGALMLISLVACSVREPPANELTSVIKLLLKKVCVVVPNWPKEILPRILLPVD